MKIKYNEKSKRLNDNYMTASKLSKTEQLTEVFEIMHANYMTLWITHSWWCQSNTHLHHLPKLLLVSPS